MKMDFSVRCSRLKTIESRKVISFFHISAVNFIVGCDLLVSLIKSWVTFLLQSQRKETSSMKHFHWYFYVGLGLFQSPPCRYLPRTLLFLCLMQLHGFEDNCFYWTQIRFLSLRIRPSILWVGPGKDLLQPQSVNSALQDKVLFSLSWRYSSTI